MKKVATNEASRPRPRRILLLIDGLEGDGAERQLCELAKGLQRRTDFEPHVGVLEANETAHAWMLATRGDGTDAVLGEEDAGRPPDVQGIKVEPFEPAQVAEGLGYHLDHDAELRQIGAAARRMVVERFDLSRFIADHVALYRELERKGAEGPTTSAEQSPRGDPPVSRRP